MKEAITDTHIYTLWVQTMLIIQTNCVQNELIPLLKCNFHQHTIIVWKWSSDRTRRICTHSSLNRLFRWFYFCFLFLFPPSLLLRLLQTKIDISYVCCLAAKSIIGLDDLSTPYTFRLKSFEKSRNVKQASESRYFKCDTYLK